ncbi:uncharacterized protein LOC114713342 isoform X2 [Neltuma alba]|uniref:uncharacterized protein LOC114713342 isoform X2 n=1 Tax=Neltuma alba TaxID=207710 RepID=UPI0010A389F4|nr:uncharacterized protein LOC114713342 isoform X2 [Prosopis alba]
MTTNTITKDSCEESPAVTDVSSSQRCAEESLAKQKGDNVGELVDMGPDFSLEASSIKVDGTIKDLCKDSPLMTDLSSSQNSLEGSSTKRKRDGIFENIDTGPDFLPEGSFMETDGARKDSCKDSSTMTDLSSSQRSAEVSLTTSKRRKSSSPIHNATISNLNGSNCSEENVGKEQNKLEKATEENSDSKLDLQGASSRSCSILVNVDLVDGETKANQVTSNAGGSEEMITDVPVMDIPEVQLEEDNGRKLSAVEFLRNDVSSSGDVSDSSLVCNKDDHSMISHFPLDRTITSHSKKKLLVLDVNGLLADFVDHVPFGYEPDAWISKKSVFKRPFCDDFLNFCFDKFHVGVWSSRHKNNVDAAIQFLMGKSASKLLFCWNQSHCTMTAFSTVENRDKPLVLKELRKLWEKLEPGLPWDKGEFNESNTLLLDDSPHKALVNPMNTAIFPYSYRYRDLRDSSLGPGGDLRTYLEGLAMAEDVREYVASNPFGQRPIREANPSWRYYRKVIDSVNASNDFRTSSSWERRSY